MELMPGDKFLAANNANYVSEYLLVSAEGFNLKDFGEPANLIVINTKNGDMESYFESLEEIQRDYKIVEIIPNKQSVARLKLKEG
jgi:hypothetical protein